MKAVAWSEFDGMFVALETDKDITDCHNAEWPVVRWNDSKKVYEQLLGGEWVELGRK